MGLIPVGGLRNYKLTILRQEDAKPVAETAQTPGTSGHLWLWRVHSSRGSVVSADRAHNLLQRIAEMIKRISLVLAIQHKFCLHERHGKL